MDSLITRLEAFDFGQAFMVWKFSSGSASSEKVIGYAEKLGMPGSAFSANQSTGDGTKLIEDVKQQLEPTSQHWFEIGWQYLFVSNMCKSPPSDAVLAKALRGFRGALEHGGIEIPDRDELQSELLALGKVNEDDATRKLERGLEKLRSIASSLDERDKQQATSDIKSKANFLKRDWTDAEKWGMGIVAAITVAGLLSLFSFRSPSHQTDVALLAGYDAAFALAMNNQGDDITAIRAEIDARLTLLGMEDLHYPAKPGDGMPVATFANQVIGYLSARSAEETCAFQLGFAGLVETNTPGTYPGFSIEETATCAGFREIPGLTSEEFLERLVESARP